MYGAGWHRSGDLNIAQNLSILFLPSCSPELNPSESIRQYQRHTYLSKRVFETWEANVDACCDARNRWPQQINRDTELSRYRSMIYTDGISG